MNDLSRRDLLTGMLQALLLALFPWLRTERGALLAEQAAEKAVERFRQRSPETDCKELEPG